MRYLLYVSNIDTKPGLDNVGPLGTLIIVEVFTQWVICVDLPLKLLL